MDVKKAESQHMMNDVVDAEALKPRRNLVLLKLMDEPEEVTPGGIYIPATVSSEQNPVAKVIAIGPDVDLDMAGFNVGDVVVIEGRKAHIFDDEHMFLSVEHIGAVVESPVLPLPILNSEETQGE